MSEKQEIKQIAGLGSSGTQIGIQNNYGLTPAEATEIAIRIFRENFPKLQEEAAEVVNQRINSLLGRLFEKIVKEKISNLEPFREPDMQYALYEAQKNYARFGTEERLETLTTLIVTRLKQNDNFSIKISIDKAIEVVANLTPEQIDYLSLVLLCKDSKLRIIKDKDSFRKAMNEIDQIFSNANYHSIAFLNMLGCLQMNLGSIEELFSEKLGIPQKEITEICPERIRLINPDYSLSPCGRIIAIINAENKTEYKFNLKSFF